MKIRKAIATTIIAATAITGLGATAQAWELENVRVVSYDVGGSSQIFTDGFESGDVSRHSGYNGDSIVDAADYAVWRSNR